MKQRLQTAGLLALTAVLVLPAAAKAQLAPRFLPRGDLIPTVLADPREPVMGGRLIIVGEGATRFGSGVEGEANIGHTLPVYVISGTSPDRAVVLGIQGGVFGRFSLDTHERDLISTDWVFAIPLLIRRESHWVRIRYRHISSHLGDEYAKRFGVERSDYSRDDIGATVYRSVASGVGLYGGGSIGLNVHPRDADRLAFSGGIELKDVRPDHSTRLFGGADVYVDQDSSWRPRVNLQAGVRFFADRQNSIRLVGEFLNGPSPQGEFHRDDATLITLGLYLDL
jgi:hypothetical protein